MHTGEIAKLAYIHLKDLWTRAAKLQTTQRESLSKSIYHFNSPLRDSKRSMWKSNLIN
jgi:hypothetical protein